jgi:hypothetical protein
MSGRLNVDVDECIARRLEAFRTYHYPLEGGKPQPFITISREFGCEAFEVASGLVEELSVITESGPQWDAFDKTLVEWVARDAQIMEKLIESMQPEHRKCYEGFLEHVSPKITSHEKLFLRMAKVIRCIAWHGRAVVIGRGGYLVCADMPAGFHVQIVAPKKWRTEQTALQHQFCSESEADRYVEMMDRTRKQFFRYHFDREAGNQGDFDLVLNNSRSSPPEMVDLIICGMRKRELIPLS